MPFTLGNHRWLRHRPCSQRSHILTRERHLETALQEHNNGSIAACHTCREERKGPSLPGVWLIWWQISDAKYSSYNPAQCAGAEGLPRQLLSGWISVCLGEGFSENSHEHLLMDVSFWGLGCYSERVVHTSTAPESPGVFANHSSLAPLNRCREWILTKRDVEWRREDREHLSPSIPQLYNLYQEG